MTDAVLHELPLPIDGGLTHCCGLAPAELPSTDRLTPLPYRVTCSG